MTILILLRKIQVVVFGSVVILNSAFGVQLSRSVELFMIIRRRIYGLYFGYCESNSVILVNGSMVIRVIGFGVRIRVFRIVRNVGISSGFRLCLIKSQLVIFDSSCIDVVLRGARISGIAVFWASGIFVFQKCSSCRVLRVVFLIEILFATVVISCRSSSGVKIAAVMATVSLMSGLVSRKIGKRMFFL